MVGICDSNPDRDISLSLHRTPRRRGRFLCRQSQRSPAWPLDRIELAAEVAVGEARAVGGLVVPRGRRSRHAQGVEVPLDIRDAASGVARKVTGGSPALRRGVGCSRSGMSCPLLPTNCRQQLTDGSFVGELLACWRRVRLWSARPSNLTLSTTSRCRR